MRMRATAAEPVRCQLVENDPILERFEGRAQKLSLKEAVRGVRRTGGGATSKLRKRAGTWRLR